MAGFLRNSPADPAVMLPQRTVLGGGRTVNVGRLPGGIAAPAFVVIMSAFPVFMTPVAG